MRRSLKLKRGFTFLELLLALVILSVALIPIMVWVPTSIQSKLKVERKTTAIFLTQAKIEEMRCKIISDFSTPRNTSSPVTFPSPYQNFFYMITDNVISGLKTISVCVWHNETPQDATIFYTQIAQR